MTTKMLYFKVHTGTRNQIGTEYTRWQCSGAFTTKKALLEYYSRGQNTVKAAEIYTPEQLITSFGIDGAKRIVKEAIKNDPILRAQYNKAHPEAEI